MNNKNLLITVTDNCGRNPSREYIVSRKEWDKSQKEAEDSNGFTIKFITVDGTVSTQFPSLSKIEVSEIK